MARNVFCFTSFQTLSLLFAHSDERREAGIYPQRFFKNLLISKLTLSPHMNNPKPLNQFPPGTNTLSRRNISPTLSSLDHLTTSNLPKQQPVSNSDSMDALEIYHFLQLVLLPQLLPHPRDPFVPPQFLSLMSILFTLSGVQLTCHSYPPVKIITIPKMLPSLLLMPRPRQVPLYSWRRVVQRLPRQLPFRELLLLTPTSCDISDTSPMMLDKPPGAPAPL